MGHDQGKRAELEQQRAPTDENQKIESAELTDRDLEKVSGSGALTLGREKLKGSTETQGDFSLEPRPPAPPSNLKLS
jgi:hypothetical protein